MEQEETPKIALKSGPGGRANSYRAIIALLVIILGVLIYFYFLINEPPVAVDKKPTLGYQHLFSIYGNRSDRLSRPTEVAVDSDQNIYVADTNNHRIMVFDSSGDYVSQFGEPGEGAGQIQFPSGIAVDEKKNVYVLSRTQNAMIIYDNKHAVRWEVSVEAPLSLTIKKDQLYLATDRGILIGNTEGQLLSSFGSRGETSGSVDHPTGIVVDDKQRVFVADSLNYRVQAFNDDGQSLWTTGKKPRVTGEIRDQSRDYGLPAGLTMADDENLYMVDAQVGKIFVINNEGGAVASFGDWGHDDGQFYYPAGIAYMGDNKFAIADKFNDRVQVIRYTTQPLLVDNMPGGLPILILVSILLLITSLLGGRWLWQRALLRRRQAQLDEGILDHEAGS